jgi:hypothetical protein
MLGLNLGSLASRRWICVQAREFSGAGLEDACGDFTMKSIGIVFVLPVFTWDEEVRQNDGSNCFRL